MTAKEYLQATVPGIVFSDAQPTPDGQKQIMAAANGKSFFYSPQLLIQNAESPDVAGFMKMEAKWWNNED